MEERYDPFKALRNFEIKFRKNKPTFHFISKPTILKKRVIVNYRTI